MLENIVKKTFSKLMGVTIGSIMLLSTAVGGTSNEVTAANCNNYSTFLGDITIVDDTQLAPNQPFVKVFRVRNPNRYDACTWTGDYSFRPVSNEGMSFNTVYLKDIFGPNIEVPPDTIVDIPINMTAPSTEGVKIARGKLANEFGETFGVRPYTKIIVTNSAPYIDWSCKSSDDLTYIGDATIPDDSILLPGNGTDENVLKAWTVEKEGPCVLWGATLSHNSLYRHKDNTQMLPEYSILIPPMWPGVNTLEVRLNIPEAEGTYREHFEVRTIFNEKILTPWVALNIAVPTVNIPPSSQTMHISPDPIYSGSVIYGEAVDFGVPKAGDSEHNNWEVGFLTYNLSNLPSDAVIQNAYIVFNSYGYNDGGITAPPTNLGKFVVKEHKYGPLDSTDLLSCLTGPEDGFNITYPAPPNASALYITNDTIEAQQDLGVNGKKLQMCFYFEIASDTDGEREGVFFRDNLPGHNTLIINYTQP